MVKHLLLKQYSENQKCTEHQQVYGKYNGETLEDINTICNGPKFN